MTPGLLPESEVVKRAEECGKTIYEMVRDPALYDLKALQAAAALALEQNPANLPTFYKNLGATRCGHSLLGDRRLFQPAGTTPLDLDRDPQAS